MEPTQSGKVRVYDRRCRTLSRTDRYRQSSCRCDEVAVAAVVEQHGMSSLGTECRLTLDCADDNPFTYVFVETLQLLQDWLSEREHFDKVLQVACWEKRDKLAALLRAFGEEIVENRTDTVPGKILREVLKYYRPCRHARILFDSMLRPEIEAMVIHLIERGFELIASRFDDHVLEARAASGRDVLKCLFNILFGVITTYSYYVDILSTAVDNGHETAIRNTLKDASVRYRLRGKGGENEDICQKLFNAAVCSGNSELVRILLQLPQLRRYVKVNGVIDTTKAGDTALHLACRMGSTLINQAFEDYLCPKAVRLALFPESEADQKQAVRRTSPSLRIMSKARVREGSALETKLRSVGGTEDFAGEKVDGR